MTYIEPLPGAHLSQLAMYRQPLLTENEISELPLQFLLLTSEFQRETFTDELISTWIALAESGSLATLPPVPDIVDFADNCAAFFLVCHNDMESLKRPPQSSSESSSATSSASPSKRGSPSKADKRWRPYPRPTSKSQSDSGSDWDTDPFDDGFESDTKLVAPTAGVIGCVYLSFSSFAESTADVGIALRPIARGRGYGRACMSKILRFAFENVRVHRVVASVFGPNPSQPKEGAKECGTVRWIFEKLGFTPEGVHRRAGFSPADGVWRDVYTLAMLDTDWMLMQGRATGRESITTPWDTMMERHESERDQMMEWMEDPAWGKLRRTGSTETIKGTANPGWGDTTSESDFSDTGSKGKGKAGNHANVDAQPDPEFDTTAFNLWPSAYEVPPFKPTTSAPHSTISTPEPHPLGPPTPSSSIGFSPPASVISLPSDHEWRSSTPSSEPSIASSPSLLAPSLRASSPPAIFTLDTGEDPDDLWASDSDFDTDYSVSSAALSNAPLTQGSRSRGH